MSLDGSAPLTPRQEGASTPLNPRPGDASGLLRGLARTEEPSQLHPTLDRWLLECRSAVHVDKCCFKNRGPRVAEAGDL